MLDSYVCDVLEKFVLDFLDNNEFHINDDHRLLLKQYDSGNIIPVNETDNEINYRIFALGTVLLLRAGKTTTIIIDGASNAGKTLFIQIWSSGLNCGFFTTMHLNSEFCFEDLVGKNCAIGEEIILDVRNADYMKLICESSPCVKISQKH